MKRIVKYAAVLAFISGTPWQGFAQPYLIPQGSETRIAGPQSGDQTHPQAAINRSGGLLVWQENTGANGAQMVKALRLDSALAASGPILAPDVLGQGDQENPQTALLTGGNALIVWQGGVNGAQKIYAQAASMSSPEAGPVAMVNTCVDGEQVTPVVTALPDGGAFVVWASRDQDGGLVKIVSNDKEKTVRSGMLGVYARKVSASGEPLGAEIRVNQFTDYNQRNPDAVTLGNGNVLVTWISEQQRAARTVDIYGRLFNAEGAPLGNEFLMSDSTNICANPAVGTTADGGVVLAWSQISVDQPTNSWDINVRFFDSTLKPKGASLVANTTLFGDQYGPRIASVGAETLVVWTSLNAQDGDWQGVFGQYLDLSGQKLGAEFQVNTTSIRNQMEPALVSDGYRQILAVWTSYVAGSIDFDLMAQTFVSTQVASDVKLRISANSGGMMLNWNTDAGSSYQVQYSEDFVLWKNFSAPRLAPGSEDSVGVTPNQKTAFYRVVLMPKF